MCAQDSKRDGVNLPKRASGGPVDFERDVPTTPKDIEVLRQLRQETPSWLRLTPDEVEALIPAHALDERPVPPPGARPFTLP